MKFIPLAPLACSLLLDAASHAFAQEAATMPFHPPDLPTEERIMTGQPTKVKVTVQNVGKQDGDEVVQLYLKHPQDGYRTIPRCALKGFRRIHLKCGESSTVEFELTPQDFSLTTPAGNWVEHSGEVEIYVGGGQPDYSKGVSRSLCLTGEDYQAY